MMDIYNKPSPSVSIKINLRYTSKALLLFQNNAHNHKITGILKQLKILMMTQSTITSITSMNT
jgi:hypothetical protein